MPAGDPFDIATGLCVQSLGQSFTITPRAGGTPQQITGILDTGIEQEQLPPGDGSTYARLFVQASAFSIPPVIGDEIASQTTKYRIVRLEEDAGGGIHILLRQEMAIIG